MLTWLSTAATNTPLTTYSVIEETVSQEGGHGYTDRATRHVSLFEQGAGRSYSEFDESLAGSHSYNFSSGTGYVSTVETSSRAVSWRATSYVSTFADSAGTNTLSDSYPFQFTTGTSQVISTGTTSTTSSHTASTYSSTTTSTSAHTFPTGTTVDGAPATTTASSSATATTLAMVSRSSYTLSTYLTTSITAPVGRTTLVVADFSEWLWSITNLTSATRVVVGVDGLGQTTQGERVSAAGHSFASSSHFPSAGWSIVTLVGVDFTGFSNDYTGDSITVTRWAVAEDETTMDTIHVTDSTMVSYSMVSQVESSGAAQIVPGTTTRAVSITVTTTRTEEWPVLTVDLSSWAEVVFNASGGGYNDTLTVTDTVALATSTFSFRTGSTTSSAVGSTTRTVTFTDLRAGFTGRALQHYTTELAEASTYDEYMTGTSATLSASWRVSATPSTGPMPVAHVRTFGDAMRAGPDLSVAGELYASLSATPSAFSLLDFARFWQESQHAFFAPVLRRQSATLLSAGSPVTSSYDHAASRIVFSGDTGSTGFTLGNTEQITTTLGSVITTSEWGGGNWEGSVSELTFGDGWLRSTTRTGSDVGSSIAASDYSRGQTLVHEGSVARVFEPEPCVRYRERDFATSAQLLIFSAYPLSTYS